VSRQEHLDVLIGAFAGAVFVGLCWLCVWLASGQRNEWRRHRAIRRDAAQVGRKS
jgi:ABC-type transporter Mla subunit MlaD